MRILLLFRVQNFLVVQIFCVDLLQKGCFISRICLLHTIEIYLILKQSLELFFCVIEIGEINVVLANHSSVGKRIQVILQNLGLIFDFGTKEMLNKFLGQLLRDVFEHLHGKIVLLRVAELDGLYLGSFDR